MGRLLVVCPIQYHLRLGVTGCCRRSTHIHALQHVGGQLAAVAESLANQLSDGALRSMLQALQFLGDVALQVPVRLARRQIGNADLVDDDRLLQQIELRLDGRLQVNGLRLGDGGVLENRLVVRLVTAEFRSGGRRAIETGLELPSEQYY